MNGFSLLVALAALAAPGVEYSFETAADSQQEYTIQIPREFLALVADGQEIQSDVPAEAGQVRRLCIRVGPAVQHTPAAEKQFRQLLVSAGRYASTDPALAAGDAQATVLWPAKGNPETSYAVRTGWQPDANGTQFFVQLDRALLRSLASGDELYVPIDPAAGRPARFIVKSGTEKDVLPRIAPPPANSVVPLAGATSAPRFGLSDATPPSTAPPATSSSSNLWPSPPRGFGGSQYTSSGTESTAAPMALSPPTAPGVAPRTDTFAPPLTPADPAGTRPPPTYSPPTTYSAADPRSPSGLAPSAEYDRPAYGSSSEVGPVGGFRTPASGYPPAEAGYSNPPSYAPAPPGYAGQQQAGAAGFPGPTYAPATVPPPSLPPRFSAPPETRTAALPPSTAPPATAATSTGAAQSTSSGESWGPFVVVLFALFFSIGGNLYLAWTALEFHSRYRNAVERLRSAARSS